MDPRLTLETAASLFVTQVLPAILGSFAIILGGTFVIGLSSRVLKVALHRAHVKPALIDLSMASIAFFGWVLIIAGVLQTLGLNQIALAVGGSISLIALGVASAASGNLGDIIAGIFLASDPDFGNGFTIHAKEITGVIERIDLRKTRIRTADGKLHVVPNKLIEGDVWIVEGRPTGQGPLISRDRLYNIHLPGRPGGT